jgi:hypothetical protein
MASGPLGRFAGLRSLPRSAARVLSVGVGFVVLVAALFAGVGAWQDRDATAAPPAVPAPAPKPAPAPPPAPAPAPTPDDDADDDADDADDDADADDADDDTSAAPTQPPATGPRPQDVSVQVLNGIGPDGTAAVDRTRRTLTDAGFRIAASRSARPYDVTTIFYTVGFEAEGRLVGTTLGVTAVRPMTDLPPERRLSSSVMVHVVVGTDRR